MLPSLYPARRAWSSGHPASACGCRFRCIPDGGEDHASPTEGCPRWPPYWCQRQSRTGSARIRCRNPLCFAQDCKDASLSSSPGIRRETWPLQVVDISQDAGQQGDDNL